MRCFSARGPPCTESRSETGSRAQAIDLGDLYPRWRPERADGPGQSATATRPENDALPDQGRCPEDSPAGPDHPARSREALRSVGRRLYRTANHAQRCCPIPGVRHAVCRKRSPRTSGSGIPVRTESVVRELSRPSRLPVFIAPTRPDGSGMPNRCRRFLSTGPVQGFGSQTNKSASPFGPATSEREHTPRMGRRAARVEQARVRACLKNRTKSRGRSKAKSLNQLDPGWVRAYRSIRLNREMAERIEKLFLAGAASGKAKNSIYA